MKWEDGRYSTYNLRISKNISGCVSWKVARESKDWVASFLNTPLGGFDTLNEAKQAVVLWAKKELTYGLKKLETVED
jgi:hypothetical protein